MYVCVWVHVCPYICTYVCATGCMCVHTYVHVCGCMRVHTCVRVCAGACVSIHMYVCVWVHVCNARQIGRQISSRCSSFDCVALSKCNGGCHVPGFVLVSNSWCNRGTTSSNSVGLRSMCTRNFWRGGASYGVCERECEGGLMRGKRDSHLVEFKELPEDNAQLLGEEYLLD